MFPEQIMIKTFPTTKILKFTIFLIVILAAGGSSVYAQKTTRQISGVRFDESIVVGNTLFKLKNVGLLRYKMVFKGYVAALYLGEEFSIKDVLQDVPKRLELSYFWSISAEDFGKAADKVLRKNESDLLLEKLRSRLKKLNKAYLDVKPNDRYALTYIPGKGTELTLNSKPLVTIMGSDFARAYFAIWLGKQPLDKGLRDTLLGAVKD
jgi:hypothetical protein